MTANHETAIAVFGRLAEISHEKQQYLQRDKFLLLAGISACHAGALQIAADCREIVITHNPQHWIRRYPTLPDAIRSEEFASFQTQLAQFCTFEKAEHLLMGFDESPPPAEHIDLDDLAKKFTPTMWDTGGVR